MQVAQQALDRLTEHSPSRFVIVPALPERDNVTPTEIDRATSLAARERLIGVVGPTSSQAALETAVVYAERGVPHIITGGTSGLLAGLGPWSLAPGWNDSLEAAFIGAFLTQRRQARSVVIVHASDIYGWGLSDALVHELTRLGVALRARVPVGGLPCGPGEVPAQLRLVRRDGPVDLVVVAGHAADMACALGAFGPGQRYLLGDGLGAGTWPELRGSGLRFDAVSFGDTVNTGAAGAFRRDFSRLARRMPNGSETMVYDAILAFATAVRAVGPDRERVRDYLMTLGRTRPPYAGVTGGLAFDGARPGRLVMQSWDSGQGHPELVW